MFEKKLGSVEKYTLEDFMEEYGYEADEICMKESGRFVYIYVNADDEFGAFVGVEYDDGTYSVIGLNRDKFCGFGEMLAMLWEG